MKSPSEEDTLPIEIHVEDLRERLCAKPAPVLLDVREDDEVALCALPGARHIPLGSLPEHLESLPRDRDLLVYCHHGGRSLRAANFLREKGFGRSASVRGGIDAWALRVDKNVPRY